MGYNGSGKSTIVTVVYAAVKSAKSLRRAIIPSRLRSFSRDKIAHESAELLDVKFSELADLYQEVSNGPEVRSADHYERVYREIIHIVATSLLSDYCDAFAAEIAAGFGSSFEDLAARNNAGKRLPLKISVSSENPAWTATIWLRGKEVQSQVELKDPLNYDGNVPPSDLAFLFHRRRRDKDRVDRFRMALRILSEDLREQIFSSIPSGTHFLPAARAGLLQSHRLVAATMVQQSPLIGLGGDIALPSLSGVVADFVSEILLRRKAGSDTFAPLAKRLESILGGEVERVQIKSEYPEIEFADATGKYPLHRTSSMVSELATLVLLLKSHVSPGELLIVEEPESHLHPRAQAQLAKILFSASRSGLYVMLTTHSDYFLSELNIALLEEFNSGATQGSTLAYWADRTDEGNARLSALEIDEADGISQNSFVEVATEQYDHQYELQESAIRKSE
ncbi:AAA family ATPase [Nocardia cyriacigeorgica]|uniref:AAA family ATPase n=1 Tax=Nocardia cyriacigeorgica TaxID=135487 RepID=UPI0018945B27|nr:AAA family ATPase [Nocardia cyriacigeorgica]MBF6436381.1 AAA family ATPase [Nocardia cyriacigeorgica]